MYNIHLLHLGRSGIYYTRVMYVCVYIILNVQGQSSNID